MLPFQYEIVQELNASDALCILSTGIGWTKPVAVFLRAHAVAPNGGSVLLLGLRPSQKEALESELQKEDPNSAPIPVEINNTVSAAERLGHYNSAPYCYVTTRILVVDLLMERIKAESFSGLFVINAEQVLENSGVEFAVRLYRQGNQNGFVRALTDQPLSFASGFNKAEKVMTALQVRTLTLWPRFQETIKDDLERTPVQVTEITQSLSPGMQNVQDAIKELMIALVEELKKGGKIDCSEMMVENCLFKNFDEMIRRQLDPIWNTVSWKIKQVVQDLKQLRELLLDLMTHDAVSFLSFLERIQTTGGDSIWQFHDAAHTVVEEAKRRVYVLDFEEHNDRLPKGKKKRKKEADAVRRATLRPVLEPLPKWDALKELLSEIQEEIRSAPAQSTDKPKSILIVCREMFMKHQLKCAIKDSRKLLKDLFHEYLDTSRELREKVPSKKQNRKQPALRCDFSLYNVRGDLSESLARLNPGVTPVESVALDNAAVNAKQKNAPGGARKTKRRQIDVMDDPIEGDDNNDEEREQEDETSPEGARKSTGSMLYSNESWGEELDGNHLLQNVYFHPLDSKNETVLWEVQPDYIIMYCPDVAFVRQIELFQAENLDKPIKLYLIYYDNSVEQSTYIAQIQRENDIFANLIENKGRITIPLDVGQLNRGAVHIEEEREIRVGSSASGRKKSIVVPRPRKQRIVVDMREFMAKLPAVLHRAGFLLYPITLEVGDYILTPNIIVERKSVLDLYSSLKSGRMYHQAKAMLAQCSLPILLIEFDLDKQFRLQNDAEIGKNISPQSITSRLVLLALHFPTLRLIWSPSSNVTCHIFDKLKQNRSEPEMEEAGQGGQRRRHAVAEVNNEKAVDILKKLPGVTDSNSRKLMSACASLSVLASTSLERLEAIMGSKNNAKALHSFLHAPCPKL